MERISAVISVAHRQQQIELSRTGGGCPAGPWLVVPPPVLMVDCAWQGCQFPWTRPEPSRISKGFAAGWASASPLDQEHLMVAGQWAGTSPWYPLRLQLESAFPPCDLPRLFSLSQKHAFFASSPSSLLILLRLAPRNPTPLGRHGVEFVASGPHLHRVQPCLLGRLPLTGNFQPLLLWYC